MWYNFLKKIRAVINDDVIDYGYPIKSGKQPNDALTIKLGSPTAPRIITFYKKEIELLWNFSATFVPVFAQKNKLDIFKKIYDSSVQPNFKTKKIATKTIFQHAVLNHYLMNSLGDKIPLQLSYCRIYFMAAPKLNTLISNKNNLYIYKDIESNEYFYLYNLKNQTCRFSLSTDDKLHNVLNKQSFVQPEDHPEECNNAYLKVNILKITDELNHTEHIKHKTYDSYMLRNLQTLMEYCQFAVHQQLTYLTDDESWWLDISLQISALVLKDLYPEIHAKLQSIQLNYEPRKHELSDELAVLYELFNTHGKDQETKSGELDISKMLEYYNKIGKDNFSDLASYIALYSAKFMQPQFFEWLLAHPEHPIAAYLTPNLITSCLIYTIENDLNLSKLILKSMPELRSGQHFDRKWFLALDNNEVYSNHMPLENNYKIRFEKLSNFFELMPSEMISKGLIQVIYNRAEESHNIAWIDVLLKKNLISQVPRWYQLLPPQPFSYNQLNSSQLKFNYHNRKDAMAFSDSQAAVMGITHNYDNFFASGLADLCNDSDKIKELFEALLLELNDCEEAATYTLMLLRLFNADFGKIEKYMQTYANANTNQPIADICQFKLPHITQDDKWDKSFWSTIALNIGPNGLSYVTYAFELEHHNRALDKWQHYKKEYLINTKLNSNQKICAELSELSGTVGYINYQTNRQFADLCLKYQVKSEIFERAIEILQQINSNSRYKLLDCIPNITIYGDELANEFDHTYVFRKLSHDELKQGIGLILGKITKNCQSIGDQGDACAVYGTVENTGGFYVLEHRGRMIGQAFAWYDKLSETLCLDSWESLRQDAKDILNPLLTKFSEKIFANDNNPIKRITLGSGGRTPPGCFPPTTNPARLKTDNYMLYINDSEDQLLIANNTKTTKSISKTPDGFGLESAIDTYANPGSTITTLALDKALRNIFFKTHKITKGILKCNPYNPIAEEGIIADNKRDHDGEYFLTHEFLALWVYYKIIGNNNNSYDKKNIFVIHDAEQKTDNLVRLLKYLKLDNLNDNVKIIYTSGIHTQTIYIRNVSEKIDVFIADSLSDIDKTANIIKTTIPHAKIFYNATHLQNDYFSCGTFALKSLMYFSKHGDKIFENLEHHESFNKKDDNLFAVKPEKLPAALYKLSQNVALYEKLSDVTVSQKNEKTLSQYHTASSAIFFGHTYHLAAIRKKYKYIDQLETYLLKNLSEEEKTILINTQENDGRTELANSLEKIIDRGLMTINRGV